MKITVLHIADCPGAPIAKARVSEALDRLHLAAVVIDRVIESQDSAGSPTIQIDGTDPFPAPPSTSPACRLYATPDGLQPSPSVAQLMEVLQR